MRKWEVSTHSIRPSVEEEEEKEEEWVFKQIFFFLLTFWEEKQGNRLFEHVEDGKKCLANMKGRGAN